MLDLLFRLVFEDYDFYTYMVSIIGWISNIFLSSSSKYYPSGLESESSSLSAFSSDLI